MRWVLPDALVEHRIGLARRPVDPSVGTLVRSDDIEALVFLNLGEAAAMLNRFLAGREPALADADRSRRLHLVKHLAALKVNPIGERLVFNQAGLFWRRFVPALHVLDVAEFARNGARPLLQGLKLGIKPGFLLFCRHVVC